MYSYIRNGEITLHEWSNHLSSEMNNYSDLTINQVLMFYNTNLLMFFISIICCDILVGITEGRLSVGSKTEIK